MQNLIFCSAAFHIKNIDNGKREKEYLFCLKQLLRFIPSNFDIIICDNTINNINNLNNNELRNLLTTKTNFLILNRNIGENNIGMGELDELIHVSENVDFNRYNKIVYFTLRKLITNPWVFEKVNSMNKKALICNPLFLHLNNNYDFYYSPATDDLYNDMFFALSSDLMINYVNYSKSKISYNLQNHVGSEQNLYKFINENNIEIAELNNVFVNQGPGKFSGIRTSIAIAKALSLTNGLNLYGFNSNDLKDINYDNIIDLYKKNLATKNLINPVYSS